MRFLSIALGTALTLAAAPALAQPAPATSAPAPFYSTTTTQLGTLLGNPETKAILLKHIPEMVNGLGENAERASGMTLKEMQDALKTYSPSALPDAKLTAIDADLAKLPAPK